MGIFTARGDASALGPRRRLAPGIFVGALLVAPGLWLTVASFLLAWSGEGFGDFQRQWTVCQYVRAGRDPYAVSLDVLRHAEEIGRPAPFPLTDIRSVHGWQEVESVLPAMGPPESTYPPAAILFLTYTLGLLPSGLAVSVWATVNGALLGILIERLLRQAIPAAPEVAVSAGWIAAGVVLLWPPTHAVFYANQFTFFSLVCVLKAVDAMQQASWRAALWFALGLCKPSISLLFLVLPLIRGRYGVLVIAGLVHLAGLLVVSGLVGSSPPQLMEEWLKYSAQCMWAMYSIQEVFYRLGPNYALLGGIVRVALLGSVVLWCRYHRSADTERTFDFLCFANLVWVGHGNYDFVLLLPPLVHALRRLYAEPRENVRFRWSAAIELLAFAAIAAGLTESVFYLSKSDDWEVHRPGLALLFRAARWSSRLALLGLFAWNAVRLGRGRPDEGSLPAAVT